MPRARHRLLRDEALRVSLCALTTNRDEALVELSFDRFEPGAIDRRRVRIGIGAREQ